jgi:hypothetical protein
MAVGLMRLRHVVGSESNTGKLDAIEEAKAIIIRGGHGSLAPQGGRPQLLQSTD